MCFLYTCRGCFSATPDGSDRPFSKRERDAHEQACPAYNPDDEGDADADAAADAADDALYA